VTAMYATRRDASDVGLEAVDRNAGIRKFIA
jgi:hypothetical protein